MFSPLFLSESRLYLLFFSPQIYRVRLESWGCWGRGEKEIRSRMRSRRTCSVCARVARSSRDRRRAPELPISSKCSANFCTLSAVSAPIFASKYAFCSIFQNLPDYLAEIFENWQNFADLCNICNFFAELSLFFFKQIFY